MSRFSAYAKLLRVPGMGALGIVPVIGAISVGTYDLYNLTIVFLIGTFASVFGYDYYLWQVFPLVLLIIVYLYFDFKLLSIKVFDRSQIRKIIGVQSFLRYSLVPIMLFSIVEILPAFLLILIPIAWYILCTPLLGERLFKPRM
jgi:hypothetical protein